MTACRATRRVAYCICLVIFCSGAWTDAQELAEPTTSGSPETRAQFKRLIKADWREVFRDSGAGDWHERWFLDGQRATVKNSPLGMKLLAGPKFGNDADHMVLWTKQDFVGDLRIDFEYTRLDSETRGVNILYIQATGSGVGPYSKDIAQWSTLRTVPAMHLYFKHMHTYHISYAAYPNDESSEDYIRARRYMPEADGLHGTGLTPDYYRTGLFKPGIVHTITVIKRGQELFMRIRNDKKQMLCHWKNETLPAIVTGRIGLRHMYTRAARYRNFRISIPGKSNPTTTNSKQ